MFLLSRRILKDLVKRANLNPRRRENLNIHSYYEEPCQRLLNALNMDSYIQPHRHVLSSNWELFVAIKGRFALILFTDTGSFDKCIHFGSEQYQSDWCSNLGAEIPPNVWHTVIALETVSVLLEVKEGPFVPEDAKELASWGPDPESQYAEQYLRELHQYSAKNIGE